MSQVVESPDTPVEGAKIVINVNTPLYQAIGGQLYRLLIETIASQVKMSDGVSVETRINTLERALAANTTTYFAETIEDRDKLRALIPGDRVIVLDATGDESVKKGAATYVCMPDLSFRKMAEDEAMDIVFNWALLQDKPQSPVADIDLAVARQHVHANKTELDQLSDDGADNLLYKGKRIHDGKVWVACAADIASAPDNLAEGGFLVINGAALP